jgi:hypothetical protein
VTLAPMTLDDVLAREAIRDLVARYNSYSDAGRFDPLFELFRPDAVMETGDAGGELQVFDGLEAITSIYTGMRDRLSERPDPSSPGYIRHITATHQIDLVDADHATGRLYFAVILPHGLDHWGRYIDQYVRTDGVWQFQRRRVYVDGRSSASFLGSA